MSQFDQAFQEQLAAHYLRDDFFISAAGTLVDPSYFENETLAAIVAVQREYVAKYQQSITLKTLLQIIQRAVAAKKVQIADPQELKRLLAILYKDPLKDRQFVIDTIADFARHQALINATLGMADALDTTDKSKVDKALASFEEAKSIGASDAVEPLDIKHDRTDRLAKRRARANPGARNGGITTGITEFDKCLTPWNGFGRKELTIFMGPPKAGKTALLVNCAVNAASAGFKVFYASCEVSEEILGERVDANISGIPLKELLTRENELNTMLDKWETNPVTGELIVQAFPIRTLKVSALKRILKKYQAQGVDFDMVVVDYGDILKPETAYADKRHGLAEIFQDLRALATEFNCALVTATQTNREGTKKAARNVTDGTDAAEDYEKVRTADALITINASPDDRQNGEVVLYFSEMRNAESGLRLRFSQDLTCMRFLIDFIGFD